MLVRRNGDGFAQCRRLSRTEARGVEDPGGVEGMPDRRHHCQVDRRSTQADPRVLRPSDAVLGADAALILRDEAEDGVGHLLALLGRHVEQVHVDVAVGEMSGSSVAGCLRGRRATVRGVQPGSRRSHAPARRCPAWSTGSPTMTRPTRCGFRGSATDARRGPSPPSRRRLRRSAPAPRPATLRIVGSGYLE